MCKKNKKSIHHVGSESSDSFYDSYNSSFDEHCNPVTEEKKSASPKTKIELLGRTLKVVIDTRCSVNVTGITSAPEVFQDTVRQLVVPVKNAVNVSDRMLAVTFWFLEDGRKCKGLRADPRKIEGVEKLVDPSSKDEGSNRETTPRLNLLKSSLQSPSQSKTDVALQPYRHVLPVISVTEDGILLWGNRILLPLSIQKKVFSLAPRGHSGMDSVFCQMMLMKDVHRILNTRFPIIERFRKYSKKDVLPDIVAGITVGLMLIPQSIAYASLAGLDPQAEKKITIEDLFEIA
ncbi:unnamed protein product [Nezara viridula]|uniref:SLC26A/SulP transporter domain-containing protein n=1 Tax=Nezara viridula TaxID=85310 RepID=A0A9P0H027_NEZVI|nr:unnamed protein product [Nezara viridula]